MLCAYICVIYIADVSSFYILFLSKQETDSGLLLFEAEWKEKEYKNLDVKGKNRWAIV